MIDDHTLSHAFARHIPRLERRIATLSAASRRYSLVRLALLIAGIAAAYLAFQVGGDLIGWIVVVAFVAAFAIVAYFHSRIEQSIRRYRIWLRIKQTHVARIEHDWENIPLTLQVTSEEEHPFELDLNLVGKRSLHHLIDTAVSTEGSMRLRRWLLERVPDVRRTLERQALVRELRSMSHFRDRLALNGNLVGAAPGHKWDGELLAEWLRDNGEEGALRSWLIALGLLAATTNTLLTLASLDLAPTIWPLSFGLYAVLYLFRRRDFEHLFEQAFELDLRLGQLRAVLLYLEKYNYHRTPNLARLCEPFVGSDAKPSALLRSVSRVASAASFQHNPLARLLLNVTVPWDLYFAHRLNVARRSLRDKLPEWLDRFYELEALSSLANVGYLNPEFVFPEIVASTGDRSPELLRAVGVGHPLIPAEARIPNDFTVEAPGRITIVTGSNMSGKSTFLRTLGVNLVLAYAGAPVCASEFRAVPMRLFTCINVSDSVNDGISYFYAEVRRLKALLVALRDQHSLPLFFLIDEIFRGTNNRERLIGSRSYVRALAGGHGAGLISTHDLELVHIADEVAGISNYHFRETIIGGKMVFDYLLRSGPSPTTNALEIMRMEGLPVEF